MREEFHQDRRTKVVIKKVYNSHDKLISRDCSKCRRHLEFELFPKTKSKSYKDGIRGQCKECMSGYFKNYEEENREDLQQYRREYYQENKQRIDHKNSEYYKQNKEAISSYYKLWREDNRSHLESYYQEWRNLNQDHLYLYKKAYAESNKEMIANYKKQWSQENKHRLSAVRANRKAIIKRLPNTLTEDEWINICSVFDGGCALTNSGDITLEHFIPISIGHGGTYLGNCYPLDGVLNYSKNKGNPFEWIKKPDIFNSINMERWNFLIQFLATQNKLTVTEFEAYVNWCFDNPRSIEEIDSSINSIELWKRSVGVA